MGMGIGLLGVVGVQMAVIPPAVADATPTIVIAGVGDHTIPGHLHMPWPSGIQAAETVPRLGWIGGQWHGPQAARAIGSLATLMTAWLVVEAHPLGLAASGPKLPMTAADQALYYSDRARLESVMPVKAGARLSERKLLEGLLILSASNVATLLGRWVAGTSKALARQMNQEAASLGLTHTHYHGPVGLSPSTVSTVADQVRLAEIVMQEPVLAKMAGMARMALPGGSMAYNYNDQLGRTGIFGVAVGSSTDDGASFIWAAHATLGGQIHTIYGGVIGVTATGAQLQRAFNDGRTLILAATKEVQWHDLWAAGQRVGQWWSQPQSSVPLAVVHSVRILGWPTMPYHVRFIANPKALRNQPLPKGTAIGVLTVTYGRQVIRDPVVTESLMAKPPMFRNFSRF
jgi:D-alanyl-D-alanine carboxypeptidase (penicillin-binding protein 5/6)